MNTKKCRFCGKEYKSVNANNSHVGRCFKNPNRIILKKKKCDKCENDINVNNFERHYKACNNLGSRKNRPKIGRGVNVWCKGLTKEIDERLKNAGQKISKILIGKPGHKHKEETKELLRKAAIKNKLGGHTSKHRIVYKGVYLHSSFELKVAQELDKFGIKWIRPNPLNWIDESNVEHRYYPDFYLEDYDIYLDPKNDYLINKDKEKIKRVNEQNRVNIIVLDKNNLTWEKIRLHGSIGTAPHL